MLHSKLNVSLFQQKFSPLTGLKTSQSLKIVNLSLLCNTLMLWIFIPETILEPIPISTMLRGHDHLYFANPIISSKPSLFFEFSAPFSQFNLTFWKIFYHLDWDNIASSFFIICLLFSLSSFLLISTTAKNQIPHCSVLGLFSSASNPFPTQFYANLS